MNSFYNIAILDDHSIILNGFKLIFSNFSNLNIKYYTNSREFLSYINQEPLDMIITDLNLPELSGIEVICKAREVKQNLKTALYTQIKNQKTYNDVINLMINGYILKTEIVELLPDIIFGILNGVDYISPELLNFKNNHRDPNKIKPIELEILKNIANGTSMKDTGQILNLTEKVIEYRMRKLRKQFECKNNIELIYKLNEYYLL